MPSVSMVRGCKVRPHSFVFSSCLPQTLVQQSYRSRLPQSTPWLRGRLQKIGEAMDNTQSRRESQIGSR